MTLLSGIMREICSIWLREYVESKSTLPCSTILAFIVVPSETTKTPREKSYQITKWR